MAQNQGLGWLLDDLTERVEHVRHALVLSNDGLVAGASTGLRREDAEHLAAVSSGLHSLAKGSACASEAFFPFPDGLLEAVAAGATAVIQPGGSIGDQAVIDAADEAGIAMVFTGTRVFRH